MNLPENVLATRDRYVDAFPLWEMPPGPAAEDKARQWSIGLAAQIGYEHPDEGYGVKRADPGRPICKDCLAQQVGATLLVWDMLSGAGEGNPKLNANPDSQDITGQIFEYVKPRNVIAEGGAGGGATPPPEVVHAPVPPYNEDYSIEFGQGCNAAYKEANQAGYDSGMVAVHASRAAWDYYSGKLTWPESYTLHLNDFRKEYGLPPI